MGKIFWHLYWVTLVEFAIAWALSCFALLTATTGLSYPEHYGTVGITIIADIVVAAFAFRWSSHMPVFGQGSGEEDGYNDLREKGKYVKLWQIFLIHLPMIAISAVGFILAVVVWGPKLTEGCRLYALDKDSAPLLGVVDVLSLDTLCHVGFFWAIQFIFSMIRHMMLTCPKCFCVMSMSTLGSSHSSYDEDSVSTGQSSRSVGGLYDSDGRKVVDVRQNYTYREVTTYKVDVDKYQCRCYNCGHKKNYSKSARTRTGKHYE